MIAPADQFRENLCCIPDADISLLAFDKWVSRGQPGDTQLLDWFEAERELHAKEIDQSLATQLAKQRRSETRLLAEHSIVRALAGSSSLREAAPRILECICETLVWDFGAMWIVDRHSRVLRCVETWHSQQLDLGAFSTATRDRTFAFGVGLPGRVWPSNAATLVSDVVDEGLPRSADAALVGLHGAIAFPIRSGAEILGVLEFFTRHVHDADESIGEMMASIGSQISQFIERHHAEAIVHRNREERRVAGRIQQGLFPRRSPDVAGYQIGGRCISALEVGGDCFDFIPVTVGHHEFLDVLVADASGHDMGAALLATEARAYVRALSLCRADVGSILTLVNQRLASNDDTEGFVTALLLQLDPRSGAVVYANAGHQPGYVLNRHGIVRHELSSTGCPLGVSRTITLPTETGAFLQQGDLVLLYTDGAVEGCSAAGEAFGVQRLISITHAHRDAAIESILDEVFHAITGFCEYGYVSDDVMVVIIKADIIAGLREPPAPSLRGDASLPCGNDRIALQQGEMYGHG